MVTTVGTVYTFAGELLAVAETALQSTDAGFDGQAYLNPGQPAFDGQCDFVTVWLGTFNLAPDFNFQTGQRFRTGPRVNLVTWNVTNGRCVDVGTGQTPPTVTAKDQDAAKHMQDGLALWNYVTQALQDSELFQGVCSQLIIGTMTAYTPQGGMAGWNLTVQGQVDGYPV